MKVFYGALKFLAVFIIVIAATLFTGSFVMQDTVAGIILRSLNKNISTKYGFESVRLSYLRKFPHASLNLKNVVVHSSPCYDKICFGGINTDTLLAAESVSVEFSITDVIKGIYNIDRITVRSGRLNLFSDLKGAVNYEISASSGSDTSSGSFILNLEKINVSGIRVIYNNAATKLLIRGYLNNGRLKSRIEGDNIDFSAAGSMKIDYFRLYDYALSRSIPAEVDLNLFSSKKGIMINKSNFSLNNYLFALSGFISTDDILDFSLTGDRLDIAGIKDYLPDSLRKSIAGYNPSGIMNIKAGIKGPLSRTSNPLVTAEFKVENGNVTYGTSALNIKNLSFSGSFTNGPGKIPATSKLTISNLQGMLGSSQYSGELRLSDFNSPSGRLQIKGKVIPAEIREFFNLKDVSAASGNVDLDLSMEGKLPQKEKYSISDFFSLNPRADLSFNSLNLGLNDNRIIFNDVSGRLIISDTLEARDLKVRFMDHAFQVSGVFLNFPGWIAGNHSILRGTADISCDKLVPEKLFPSLTAADTSGERMTPFPGDLILDIDIKINDLIYKTLEARNISGKVSYKPRILNFKELKLNALDGMISGEGFVVQNTNKTFVSRGSFVLDKIDINKAFRSFSNFGQSFIKADNLAGVLSGSVSFLLPMDSLFNPVIKTINAEGKYVLSRGALLDFGPVKELSDFIELSELENINFEKLENDFFIRNNYLYIPVMDVRSSAANLTIDGKHSFDNEYEYHVKILLSEALSKKIRKPKTNTTEFGAVEDDGLGRTSLLLKIVGKGETVKVSYDVKAAGTKVKNEIKSERQSLKTILNQEYGWYKNDTSVNKNTDPVPKKFRITWDETDSARVEKDEPAEQKPAGFKNLFRKKNE